MTTATISLTDFLLARIAEDDAVARSVQTGETALHVAKLPEPTYSYVVHNGPDRILAECEAKRPLIHRWQNATPDGDDWAQEAWAAMCAWAVAYTGHPEYNPDWRP